MIYFNHAATSYPKPKCVVDTFVDVTNALPSGQYRSVGIFNASDIYEKCKEHLSYILGVKEKEQIFFTSGATESLNLIFYGLGVKPAEIITTVIEHNSILRPLYNAVEAKGNRGEPVLVSCDENGFVSPMEIENAITENTKMIVLNHCSNVTGAIQDAQAIGEIARRYGLYYVLDVSQSAGCIPIKADEWNVTALAFTGHKSLLGLQGTGGYYVRKGIEFVPFKFGGSGKDSKKLIYTENEYEYMVGTQNMPGIASLNCAAEYILERTVDTIFAKENYLRMKLQREMQKIPRVILYGQADVASKYKFGPVLGFNIEGMKPSDTSYILQNCYGIITRAGIQCAPLIHERIGTPDGIVRVSIGYSTKSSEIEKLVVAIRELVDEL